MRAYIVALAPKPESRHKHRQATCNQGGIIHRLRIDRHGKWKAEDNDKDSDIKTGHPVYDEPNWPSHPEPAWCDVLAPTQEMWKDGREIGERGEDDEGAYESGECR